MSATFLRLGETEGVEMPVKEPVSKSMICMMFDIEEKAFLYILTEDGAVVSTMLGSESTFIPKTPGKYYVKTDLEVDDTGALAQNELEETWKTYKKFKKNFFQCQPSEVIAKIFNKVDYQSFGKLAQTCELVQKFIQEMGGRITIKAPFIIRVEFYDFGPCISVEKTLSDLKSKIRREFDDVDVFKPFRVRSIVVNALRKDFTAETIIELTGITTDELVIKCHFPICAHLLIAKLKPKNVHFIGNTGWGGTEARKTETTSSDDGEKTDFFIPEEFPDIEMLTIDDERILGNCFQTELYMRTVKKATLVVFQLYENYDSMGHYLKIAFEQYMKHSDRGINKFVKIRINDGGCIPSEVMREMLKGKNFKKIQGFPVKNNYYYPQCARVYHNEMDICSEFLVQVCQIKLKYATVSFGVASDDFGKFIEITHNEEETD